MRQQLQHWHGTLTEQNFKDVAERLRTLLTGKDFIFVRVDEVLFNFCPVLDGSRTLVSLKIDEPNQGFTVEDDQANWSLNVWPNRPVQFTFDGPDNKGPDR